MPPRGAPTVKPNILLITADQMRWDCLGAARNPSIQTPHLDALAAGPGVAQGAVCDALVEKARYYDDHALIPDGKLARSALNRSAFAGLPANQLGQRWY